MTTKEHSIQHIRLAEGARILSAIIVAVGSSACAPPSQTTHQTVDYYRANREVREAKVAECANDPGSLGNTPDCINALQAAQLESIGSLQDLPPMGLVSEEEQAGSSDESERSSDSPGRTEKNQGRQDR